MYALIEGYAIAPRLITECVQGIYDSEESVPMEFKENPRNSIVNINTFHGYILFIMGCVIVFRVKIQMKNLHLIECRFYTTDYKKSQ